MDEVRILEKAAKYSFIFSNSPSDLYIKCKYFNSNIWKQSKLEESAYTMSKQCDIQKKLRLYFRRVFNFLEVGPIITCEAQRSEMAQSHRASRWWNWI